MTQSLKPPIFPQLLDFFRSHYPEATAALDFSQHLSPLLFCPDQINLPLDVKHQAEQIVRAFFALRCLEPRKRRLENLTPALSDPGNTSVLMSYDFHLDPMGQLRLIEINTNASMSLMVDALYRVHGLQNPFAGPIAGPIIADFQKEIWKSFQSEALARRQTSDLRTIAIVDDTPSQQRLYSEFLLYQELFKRNGVNAKIADVAELKFAKDRLWLQQEEIDFVYNRHTDFYLQNPHSAALHSALGADAVTLSPHPHEYRLLADKERLIELSRAETSAEVRGGLSPENWKSIEKTLIRSIDVREFASADELWSTRKKWFFKPQRSFGSKAAYRGASISKKMIDVLLQSDYIAQEYVAAPEIELPSAVGRFKYDLRFYVYRDQIQLCCARIYQGQMTNSQTPGGGIAAIQFN